MSKTDAARRIRIWRAFAIAPVVALLCFLSVGIAPGIVQGDERGVVLFFVTGVIVGVPLVLAIAFGVCAPIYFLLRRYRVISLPLLCALAFLVVGTIPFVLGEALRAASPGYSYGDGTWIVENGIRTAYGWTFLYNQAIVLGAFGIIGAIAFWLIAFGKPSIFPPRDAYAGGI